MNTEEIIALDKEYVMQTYGRQPLALKEGKGAVVWDVEGRPYIDCVAGIAVNNVGHAHPNVAEAISKQAHKLIHTSNIYYTEEQVRLAELLVKVSPHQKAFFCNSGAEANEGAIKLARKYTGKGEIIAMENSFHGRTITTITATGQHKYKKNFGPLTPGFKHVPYGDVEAVREAITHKTAAVLVEPIQGEGGIIIPPEGYLEELKKVCHENDVLLIFDEVQTGFGRTGEMFASQTFKVAPDITTLAKAIAGGFPMGAVLASEEVGNAFEPGDHAATFGGGPLACAAALASIQTIQDEGLLAQSRSRGECFKTQLKDLFQEYGMVEDVRGRGMMLGMEMGMPCASMVDEMRQQGVLVNCTAGNVLRFVPPLVITTEQINEVTDSLDEVLRRNSD
ncbi:MULTISPECIES: acetylornithine transaminase [Methanobacterium]|jgi:acetylornithine/N-succinyldiaminopimelate aminotransferase|uniref:Acetylornithine aminotransferase n=1 Tax=Methanobacterium formicicum TaxID=2162 RepID=A0A090I8R6_METFO|nr:MULTISPECIES: acetylornithine transaminase [Methanobacterium]AIS33174.1 acetylornithine aminotransferase ArgD2 [Methanobacterium formicicum]KUK72929.1 MAG: Acetylornithine aminotransferase [Methanobacterium sp. 42_16]MBF4474998.1 acetylornithine transaminase [Methanobacterium formicicum]MDD4809822.1 acetylornithine transaminase [Methanobacterium formicicum]MDG3548452.1 acetylornithine transaminase [Methanobacterium formicicum]